MIHKYIGIPFKPHGRDQDGCDCIGLVLLINRDKGIFIDDIWNYDKVDGSLAKANFINEIRRAELGKSNWKRCDAQEGAMAVFRVKGAISHVGYIIDDNRFIHVMEGTRACVESLESPMWQKRYVGAYIWCS